MCVCVCVLVCVFSVYVCVCVFVCVCVCFSALRPFPNLITSYSLVNIIIYQQSSVSFMFFEVLEILDMINVFQIKYAYDIG